MLSGPRILLVSASTGNGHTSALSALEKTMLDRGIEVRGVDALDYAPRGFRTWYRGGYELLVRRHPPTWGHLFRISDTPRLAYHSQTALDFTFMARLTRLIRSYRPDWVVCTHSLPQPRLAYTRRRLQNFRVAVVVTDQYPHLMWCRGDPDHYFVPSAWTGALLEARRPGSAAKTSVTGIPIHPVFAEPRRQCAARREMGLREDVPVILLTSGGIGGGPLVDVARALSSLPIECQIVAVCGRNKSAYKRLRESGPAFASGGQVRFRTEGYLSQNAMAALMHASDFVIGKPGGITVSECFASGCPMLVYTPFMIPGQEEGNARFLEHVGAGKIAAGPHDLLSNVTTLLETPEALQAMRERALQAATPHAAQDIVRRLCELWEQEQAIGTCKK